MIKKKVTAFYRRLRAVSLRKWLKITALIFLFFLFWSNFRVHYLSRDFIFYDSSDLPEVKTALLLGTGKTLRNGNKNLYFDYRIDACVRLYREGKVRYILVSGDNSKKEYNEPQDMKDELIKRGIPADKIFLDYAGFDTYDSVLRAYKIFGQKEFIVVSQKFHNQRAVYIARRNGLNAYGYNASDVKKMAGIKTKTREYFACLKAYFEVMFNVDPYFLGEKISIP